jgi:hypothetical protein
MTLAYCIFVAATSSGEEAPNSKAVSCTYCLRSHCEWIGIYVVSEGGTCGVFWSQRSLILRLREKKNQMKAGGSSEAQYSGGRKKLGLRIIFGAGRWSCDQLPLGRQIDIYILFD